MALLPSDHGRTRARRCRGAAERLHDAQPCLTRRLQRGLSNLVAVLALIVAAGGAHAADSVLNVYNWSDYIGETTIADFEKETGIKVNYNTFDSNEALHAKLVAGHTGYDIVVPSSAWAALQIQAGIYQKLDKSKIPNFKNVDPVILKKLESVDPGNQYIAPWAWGITTLGINVDKVKKALGGMPLPENAWDLIFKPEYASKLKSCGLSLLDSGDEVFPAALLYLGKSPSSNTPADYQAAAALLKTIRPDVTLFSSSGYINDLANGALCVAMGWNGDIGIAARRAKEAKNGQNIQILLPKTGAVLLFDSMAIPADAEHVEAAYKWINFIYRPDVQAGIVNHVSYANPVPAAAKMIAPDILANPAIFLKGADLERMVAPGIISNDTRRLRTRLYTTFKTGL